jgi:hypothetical protein
VGISIQNSSQTECQRIDGEGIQPDQGDKAELGRKSDCGVFRIQERMMRKVAAGAGAGVKGVEVKELNACGKADSIAKVSLKRFVASKEQT